ncbi:MAG TPA: energy-coupling factor ABC transporter permease [Bryobacteraceae bacterium]|nr:energy-coupling factor ABC transporter permease [Bryobacteraceae bacterium]
MHIPDGILSVPVWAALNVAAAPGIGLAVRRAKKGLSEGQAPLLGVMGAFVFAAQCMNFPVGFGTSGHLLGGALLAMTLGPGAAVIILTAILILQALLFQDGGLLALGANAVNMALIGVWAGWIPYRMLSQGPLRTVGIFAGGFLSVLASAAAAILELRLSGVPMSSAVVGVSSLVFLATATIEGLITVAVLQAVERLNPGWLRQPRGTPGRAAGLLVTAAILIVAAGVLYASALPDGFESLAHQLGIASRERTIWNAPLPDYEAPFFVAEWSKKAVAGLAGLGLIYGICMTVGRLLIRQRSA